MKFVCFIQVLISQIVSDVSSGFLYKATHLVLKGTNSQILSHIFLYKTRDLATIAGGTKAIQIILKLPSGSQPKVEGQENARPLLIDQC